MLKKSAAIALKAHVLPAIEREAHRALKEVADEVAIKVFAENVRKSVETTEFASPGMSVRITVSLGIAEFPADGDGLEALIAQAEHALQTAKESGCNTWKSAA